MITNKVKEHIGFHYFLTEIQQCTLILLKFNIFLKKYWAKSKANPSQHHNIFAIQDADSIMCGFCCIAFIDYMIAGKTLLVIPIYFLLMTIKRMISTLKINMAEVSLYVRLKKVDETKNCLLK